MVGRHEVLLRGLVQRVLHAENPRQPEVLQHCLEALSLRAWLRPVGRWLLLAERAQRPADRLVAVVEQAHEPVWVGKHREMQAPPTLVARTEVLGLGNDADAEALPVLQLPPV